MQFEYSLAREMAGTAQADRAGHGHAAAVFRDPANPSGIGQFAVIQAMAPPLGMEVIPVDVRDAAEIERVITAFARSANGGLIATGGQASVSSRVDFLSLPSRHRLPAVYPYRFYVEDGGLISYGPDLPGLFRQAAGYVDRILKGEKPVDLPVQAPTKYELVIDLKTAKALGLDRAAARCSPVPTRSSNEATRRSSPCSAARRRGRWWCGRSSRASG